MHTPNSTAIAALVSPAAAASTILARSRSRYAPRADRAQAANTASSSPDRTIWYGLGTGMLFFVPHPRARLAARHAVITKAVRGKDGCRGQIPRLNEDIPGTAPACQGPRTLAQISSLQIRHRGTFSYVDATLTDATTLKLCRLRYVGSARQWQFAIYRASHDDYDESVFPAGLPIGTCQDALDTACGLYLNDPTAWT